jgi:hypothetical protein
MRKKGSERIPSFLSLFPIYVYKSFKKVILCRNNNRSTYIRLEKEFNLNMVGEELSQHLQHLEKQLTQLIRGYHDYESRNNPNNQRAIPLLLHILYVAAIISIIITATFAIGSFIVEAREFITYIAASQAILTIGFYMFFVKKMSKDMTKDQKPQPKTSSTKTIYELDQQRFAILQELASSPIPHPYITPTAITKMNQLVRSGMCKTIDECIAHFKQGKGKLKHEEELRLIQKLQMISYQ